VLGAWKRWQYSESTVTIAGDPGAAAVPPPATARRLPPESPARNPFSPQRLANPS